MDITPIVLIAGVLVVVLIVCLCTNSRKEGFLSELVGPIAPVKKDYGKCLSECQRQDPYAKIVCGGPWCGRSCNVAATKTAECLNLGYKLPQQLDACEDACSGIENRMTRKECYNKCKGVSEVTSWCKVTQCPYSSDPESCVKVCTRMNVARNSGGSWSWK